MLSFVLISTAPVIFLAPFHFELRAVLRSGCSSSEATSRISGYGKCDMRRAGETSSARIVIAGTNRPSDLVLFRCHLGSCTTALHERGRINNNNGDNNMEHKGASARVAAVANVCYTSLRNATVCNGMVGVRGFGYPPPSHTRQTSYSARYFRDSAWLFHRSWLPHRQFERAVERMCFYFPDSIATSHTQQAMRREPKHKPRACLSHYLSCFFPPVRFVHAEAIFDVPTVPVRVRVQ